MAINGYSGTPLIKKLGIANSSKILVINALANYFKLLGKDVKKQFARTDDCVDLVHLFVTSKNEFERGMRKLAPLYSVTRQWLPGSAGIKKQRAFLLILQNISFVISRLPITWSTLKFVQSTKSGVV